MDTPAAIRHPLIHQQRFLITEMIFQLGQIPTPIRIRCYREVGSERVTCEQSHYLQTPLQDEPSFESSDDHSGVDEALATITGEMAAQYQQAEQAGHRPSDDWLLPSRDFD
ncbi:hypothetical protein [Halomonas sp. PGE1]|uniref:hypothetical protein n=1 Tax=Halomonas sp. PGE1 TaxID=2730360 RepID=UPI0014741C56|nr:hypothetical protein [Halomonas sp. PGE1]QJQ97542.1 hypothetical protein HIR79_01765 [Halomonas sp. PGE1]